MPGKRMREPLDVPGGTFTVTRLPATVGTSTLPPSTASGMLIGTSIKTFLAFASKELMRFDVDANDNVLTILPLPRHTELFAILETRGHFDVDVAIADAEADRAAECRGQERNIRFDFDGLRRRCRTRSTATGFPAAPGG